jgi:epoxide hydrolase 4
MICLHGFLDCWVGWRFQIAALAPHFRLLLLFCLKELQKSNQIVYRVVAVDLKGYGESEKPTLRGKYKIEEVVSELAEFIVAVGRIVHSKFNFFLFM